MLFCNTGSNHELHVDLDLLVRCDTVINEFIDLVLPAATSARSECHPAPRSPTRPRSVCQLLLLLLLSAGGTRRQSNEQFVYSLEFLKTF
eukprot:COSAG06_NODE_6243_length_3018_cov_4.183967_3_plen_90_part_00